MVDTLIYRYGMSSRIQAKKARDDAFWKLQKTGVKVRRWTDRSGTGDVFMLDVISSRQKFYAEFDARGNKP